MTVHGPRKRRARRRAPRTRTWSDIWLPVPIRWPLVQGVHRSLPGPGHDIARGIRENA